MLSNIVNLFKHNFNKTDYKLEVDIHSHLIPGIDDGAKTTFESIKMIKAYKKMGYKKLITTPHTMWHRYKNTPEIILEKLEYLKDALVDHGVEIELEAASEYFLDEYFVNALKNRDILPFGKKYLLFETSYSKEPYNLKDIIFEIQLSGYTPVFAHPERYLYLHENFERYEELKELGMLFQVNINSFAGYYSKNIKNIANKLAQKGLIDFLGSDIHNYRQIEILKQSLSTRLLKSVFEKNSILNSSLL